MKKENVFRGLFYIIGMLVLALGITLNTKANLGVSPLISVAFCISKLTGINLGDMTLIWYTVFVLVEIVCHMWIKRYKEISDCYGKKVSTMKNIIDAVCVTITIIISLVFEGKLIGVGIGTILAVIFVGRVVAVFNYFLKSKILKLGGLEV